jgi:hypothetical protein
MENDDEFQSSRLTIKNDLILEPITKTAEEFLKIINDPKNTKGVFVKINTELYNNHFGPSVPPNTKKSLEKKRIAMGFEPFAPKTPEAIEKRKGRLQSEIPFTVLESNNKKPRLIIPNTKTIHPNT